MRHLRTLLELSTTDVEEILKIAKEIKGKFKAGERTVALPGRVLTQVFEKPSLRTRTSFEAAIIQLGGSSIFMSCKDAGLEGREALGDVSRVLSSYSDAVAMRTFSQQLIEDFASFSSCPVINALSDDRHPCQALTDVLTIDETFGRLNGRRLVYVGDGNNVAASLAIASAMLNISMAVSAPEGYRLNAGLIAELQRKYPGCDITHIDDPRVAVKDADVVYTDVWTSMGQETEAKQREQLFAPFQVNAALLAAAPDSCRFMHDLPAHRGKEVTDEVMDGPKSIAFQQAENRMHLAKGLLVWLLDRRR
ncbi:MAG: ornithine carbamoyltransferase [Planctomycetota bacterium]|nr:ornithine carbamoyltransferase [Planctomycetota bacterium]